MKKIKRYWILDAVTGADWVVDAYTLAEAAAKIGRTLKQIRLERMHYTKASGRTFFENPARY